MSLSINNYNFEGPFKSTDKIDNQPGIFAIICSKNDKLYLVDIGELSKIKSGIDKHNRREMWKDYCDGRLFFACHYTPGMPQSERISIVKDICNSHEPPLGQE